MSAVRDSVTLHPETVKKAESIAKKPRQRRKRSAEPEVTRRYTKKPPAVNPKVWNAGQDAIRRHGYSQKVIVNSASEIVVVNDA